MGSYPFVHQRVFRGRAGQALFSATRVDGQVASKTPETEPVPAARHAGTGMSPARIAQGEATCRGLPQSSRPEYLGCPLANSARQTAPGSPSRANTSVKHCGFSGQSSSIAWNVKPFGLTGTCGGRKNSRAIPSRSGNFVKRPSRISSRCGFGAASVPATVKGMSLPCCCTRPLHKPSSPESRPRDACRNSAGGFEGLA